MKKTILQKVLAVILAVQLVIMLTACTGATPPDAPTSDSPVSSSPAGDVIVSPSNPDYVDSSSSGGGEEPNPTPPAGEQIVVRFLVDGAVYSSVKGKKGDVIQAPLVSPYKDGYEFVKWEGLEEGVTFTKNKDYVGIFTQSSVPTVKPEIKNVIYLIADGLSSSTIDLARALKGAPLYMDEILLGQQMVVTTNISTIKNADKNESWKISNTDSSSCGTAIATGRKTYKNGQGQITHDNDNDVQYANDGVKTDWKNGETERFKSILRIAQDQGKKTAVITTADILDSTPSAFYSHSERGYWDTIYSDLKKSGVDVIVGTNSYAGNTLASWRSDFASKGYKAVEYNSKASLEKIKKGDKFISIASSGNGNHDPFWDYNNYRSENLRVFDYFNKTIELFDGDEEGFFIMLEGGEIDIGGHNNEPQHALSEIYAFDQTVKLALDYAAKRNDTIVVVTADHGNSQFYLKNGVSAESCPYEWSQTDYFYKNFDGFTRWIKGNAGKRYDGHTLENVLLGVYEPKGLSNPFKSKTEVQNIEIPRYIASLLNADIDRINRAYNGISEKEEFGYVVVDFDKSLQIGVDEKVTAVKNWAVNTEGCGFIKASEVGFHDWENANSDTCYALKCFGTAKSMTGVTITLPSPINVKTTNLTSMTLRCQISMEANGNYPVCRIYKGNNAVLNDGEADGVSLAAHANSKVVDINLGAINFARLADSDGMIRSFTIAIQAKTEGYVYIDELRFAYTFKN